MGNLKTLDSGFQTNDKQCTLHVLICVINLGDEITFYIEQLLEKIETFFFNCNFVIFNLVHHFLSYSAHVKRDALGEFTILSICFKSIYL